MAVHLDGTRLHVVETHQQVDKSGLSTAGGPDDGDTLSRFHRQVQILDQGNFRCIGEVNLIKEDPSFRL